MQWICDTVNWIKEQNEDNTETSYSAPASTISTRKRYKSNKRE